MAEVLGKEKEVVHPGLTVFVVDGRRLELREMSIGRTEKLGELLFKLRSGLQKHFMDQDGKRLPEDTVLSERFVVDVADCIVDILNFLFRLEGEAKITTEWYKDSVSIRVLDEIVAEAASQSRVNWLVPFFGPFCQVLKDSTFVRATNPPTTA